MQNHINLEKLEKDLVFFNKMYDIVRVVDPIKKRVVESRSSIINKTNEICHDYWKNGKICDNCISVRAHEENRSFVKLEQNPESIMLVTAIPIENGNEPIVLELLKNVTDSMFIGSGDYSEGIMINRLVSEVNDMVIRDSLTSLYNRRFIDERLPVDIVKATMEGLPLSIIFMDMDNLKEINDTLGHAVGDFVVKEVANVIQNSIRFNDWAARYGGDEFVICLYDTNYSDAYNTGERIRKRIEEMDIPELENANMKSTVSVGIHTIHKSKLTAKELLAQADDKMYEAKRKGKNIVIGNGCMEEG